MIDYSEVSDPQYELGQEVYIIPPSDSLHTLTGTIDRQPTPEEPYYIVVSDASGKEWSMVAASIVSPERVAIG